MSDFFFCGFVNHLSHGLKNLERKGATPTNGNIKQYVFLKQTLSTTWKINAKKILYEGIKYLTSLKIYF